MKRLIVTNSALAYPRVPDDVLRPGDGVLPLVERFEEALFMASPGYGQLREQFPELNLRARAIARQMGALLPDSLAAKRDEWGHCVWELFADTFVKFTLGPVLCNTILARHAAAERPATVVAYERPSDLGWWTGRQMVDAVAATIAQLSDAALVPGANSVRRWARSASLRTLPFAQTLNWFRRHRHGGPKIDTEPVDVAIVVLGPSLLGLCERVSAGLTDAGLTAMRLDLPVAAAGGRLPEGPGPTANLYDWSDDVAVRAAQTGLGASLEAVRGASRALADFEPLRGLPAPMLAVIRRRLWASVVRDATICRYHALLWQRALDHLQPRALLTFVAFNEHLAPGVLQARHRGVPTMCLQHGIWGPYFRAGAFLPYEDVLVFGDYAREVLAPVLWSHTQMTTTGHAGYDGTSPTRTRDDSLRGELLGDCSAAVLVTTQATELRLAASEERWWIECIAESCGLLDAHMIIKAHPQEEDLRAYEALAERRPETVSVIPHGTRAVDELILASDVLMTRFSTTALEAALLGTPVIQVNLLSRLDQYPFAEEGAAIGAYSPAEIHAALQRVLIYPEHRRELVAAQQRFLDRHLGLRDGRATERVVARVVERVESEGPNATDGEITPPWQRFMTK